MKTIVLVLGCFLFSIVANASENPYIELAQPSDLTEVHVNTSQFNPKNGKVTKTEISFGDGTVVTNNSDAYHKYASAGNYTITVKIWTSLNGMSTFSKTVDINPQYRILPVANSTVFSNSSAKTRKYSFSISASQAEILYRIKLTRIPDAQEASSSASNSPSCDLNLGVRINSIPLFKNNEIDCNTAVIEKLVKLKALNEIVYDMQQNKKNFSTEISAIEIIKDYSAPVIASSLTSGALTKRNTTNITISDESDITTYIWDNQQNLLFSTVLKNFEIPLVEGLNNFVIQSIDDYDNSSQYFHLSSITRDSTPAALNAILNAEYIYSSYPQNFTVTINSDEDLQALTVNGVLALWVAPRTYSYVLNVASPGQVNIELRAFDLAGNETVKAYQPIFSIDNIAPAVSTNLSDNAITSQQSVSVNIVDNADTVTEVYSNGNLIKSTTEKEFEIVFESQGANSYVIKSRDAYNNEAVDVHFDVVFDSVAPQTVSLAPEENAIIRTNSLPFIIPVNVEFNESVTTIAINSISATLVSSTKAAKEILVSAAGPVIIRIEASDLAGNSTIIERTVVVEFSNIPPVLTLDTSVKNMLTNKTEVRIFGTSNINLAAAKLNGSSISVGDDGLSFSGFFSPPVDGRYRIEVVGTDLFGNTTLVVGYVRVLADLPDVFENYPTLTAIPTETGHRIDYGPGFKQPHIGDTCADMKRIFEQKEEFAANLQQIQKREDAFLDQFPEGYDPDIPTTESLMNFIGQIDEPLNYVKAGYLAVCEGKIIMPETDCPQNREILKLLTGQYPEPMIIRSIPFIAPFIQDFLISRYNICTGLDTSGLSCEDMKSLLPLVANLTFPSVGQMMSSPIGKFVMDELMCKEICEIAAYKDTPICKQAPLPQIPQLPGVAPVSFTPPDLNFPNLDLGLDDWGSGGGRGWGNGSSCGGWNKRCKSGGSGGRWKFGCQTFPQLPRCVAGNPGGTFDEVEIDENVVCPAAGWTLAEVLNAQSPTNYLLSVISKCSKNAVPGVPQTNAPVITVTAPVQNQAVSDIVRVTGFVDDAHALVRVNGVDVNTIPGIQGAHFDVTIANPVSRTVIIEAANQWGEHAIPVVINLAAGIASELSAGKNYTCGIFNGAAKCWGINWYGNLGDGTLTSNIFKTSQFVVGLTTGVSKISAGETHTCAIVFNTIKCWGSNYYGQLGDGTTQDSLVPVSVIGISGNVEDISVGIGSTCAVVSGRAYCWGSNGSGQLGNGITGGSSLTPTQPIGLDQGVMKISVGDNFACAIQNSGVKCWGINWINQLGSGMYFSQINSPTNVVGLGAGVVKITTGLLHSCAILSGGAVKCWGANFRGQCGNGGPSCETPQDVIGLSAGVTHLSLGYQHSCALLNDGSVRCWGNNNALQLYTPTWSEHYTPIVANIPVPLKFITASFGNNNIAITAGDKYLCWGEDWYNQCPTN